ncbi:MAG TPA: NAD(P)H-hydrate dehydratase [Kofleriaceae bacterium]|jgi:hydroxyethylthiazole kinase-like uncharacterized protein yjeF
MLPVLTTDEMRALDRATMDAGLGGFTLMETAGRGVAEKVLDLIDESPAPAREMAAAVAVVTKSELDAGLVRTPSLPRESATPRVVVVCGPGNNGGDGFVVGRVLRDHGVEVAVLLAAPRNKVTGHALQHLELFEKFGGVIAVFGEPHGRMPSHFSPDEARVVAANQHLATVARASIVVDALFGIGTTRPIEGALASLVDTMNTVPIRVAIDVPSGINTDTGTAPMTTANREGACIRATHTVTVAAHKVALVSSPGFTYAGEVSVVDIGVPASFLPRGEKAAAAAARRRKHDAAAKRGRDARTVVSGGIAGMDARGGKVTVTDARGGKTVIEDARSVSIERTPPPVEAADEKPLSIPPADAGVSVGAWLLEESDLRGWLPIPQPLDHKGTRGHVLVISGAPEMRGAGRLAASAALASGTELASDANATSHEVPTRDTHDASGLGGVDPHAAAVSALRGGAGLVTLAGDGDVIASEAAVMTKSIGDDGLAPLLEKKTAVVIGPGLGTSETARARVHEVLKAGKPCVLDADALNLLAKEGAEGIGKAGPVIITPHPAEAARLLGMTTAEVEADRMAAVRALAKKTHAIVVLKGARTVICDGSEPNRSEKVMRCFINPTGAPSLSTGGTGDVLAGLIGGLLAQGVFGVRAACCAAFLHGRAGEMLFARYGRGALSSDLPRVIAELIGAMTPAGAR